MPYIAHSFYKFSRGVLRNAPDKHKNMEKIKTIEEFSADYLIDSQDSSIEKIRKKMAKKMAVDFARYHVGLALRQATEEAKLEVDDFDSEYPPRIDKGSISNAYSLSNIK
jgi:hypothetical protein